MIDQLSLILFLINLILSPIIVFYKYRKYKNGVLLNPFFLFIVLGYFYFVISSKYIRPDVGIIFQFDDSFRNYTDLLLSYFYFVIFMFYSLVSGLICFFWSKTKKQNMPAGHWCLQGETTAMHHRWARLVRPSAWPSSCSRPWWGWGTRHSCPKYIISRFSDDFSFDEAHSFKIPYTLSYCARSQSQLKTQILKCFPFLFI